VSLPRSTPGDGAPRGDAALAGRVETGPEPAMPTWAAADLTNVIPFVKRQREAGETGAQIRFVPGERPAPAALKQDRGGWMLALLLGSFSAHAGVYWMLNREPPPLASVGIESMSVEIVLGTDMPAGRAEAPAKSEQEPAQLSSQAAQDPAQPEPHQEALQQVEPEPSPPAEAAPAVSRAEQPPAPPAPAPSMLTVPLARDAVPPLRAAPPKRAETAPPRQRKQQHPVRQRQAMLPATTGAPATPANGVGRGRSDADSNYRGLVAAHLARYKRFPTDARSRGDQGVASVAFSLDAGGRVSSVALVRGSGVASLDHEVQAMVHRASPFPAPPSGRPMSFTVPVSFRLQ
jgi:periplasmic protein TonB